MRRAEEKRRDKPGKSRPGKEKSAPKPHRKGAKKDEKRKGEK